MPYRSDDEKDDAPPPSGITTPTKSDCNDGTSHGCLGAEVTEYKLDSDAQEEFNSTSRPSTGKKRKKSSYLKFTEVKRW